MVQTDNLQTNYINKDMSYNMTKVFFEDGENIPELKREDIFEKDNNIYININNITTELSHVIGLDIPIYSISKYIKKFFENKSNTKLFFVCNETFTNRKQKELTYIVFSSILEITQFNEELKSNIFINNDIKKYEKEVKNIINEYYDYSTWYNKSNQLRDISLNNSHLYTSNGKDIKNVINNEDKSDFQFTYFYNNIPENKKNQFNLIDLRLRNFNDKNEILDIQMRQVQIEEDWASYFSLIEEWKNKKDYQLYLYETFSELLGHNDFKVEKSSSNEPYFYFNIITSNKTIKVSITGNEISINDKELGNKLKEKLNGVYNPNPNITSDNTQNNILSNLSGNLEEDKKLLRYFYSLKKKGNIESLNIDIKTPINKEIETILLEHFKDIVSFSHNSIKIVKNTAKRDI